VAEKISKAKTAGVVGGLVALLGAGTGLYTAVHGTHTTETAVSRNDTPVVINRPHDVNGSPLPVTIVTPGPNGGPPIVIVGHGAPGSCTVRGKLPDPSCTPGAVNAKITPADLCPTLGKAVTRSVSQSTKDDVRFAYNDDKAGEIDHLISLELGGSNDISNLWPEDGKIPNPKDAVENRLHKWVCSGSTPKVQASRLHAAQQAIRTDWTTADRIEKN
jgi:hypothetical protein